MLLSGRVSPEHVRLAMQPDTRVKCIRDREAVSDHLAQPQTQYLTVSAGLISAQLQGAALGSASSLSACQESVLMQ